VTARRRAPDRDLLLEGHQFPGEYIVKAFGPGSEVFAAAIRACATAVVGADRAAVSERKSRKGARMCVTLTLRVQTVDEVIAVYERIHDVPGLALIL
jgi:putative lipoic acid-binding regulatory protein